MRVINIGEGKCRKCRESPSLALPEGEGKVFSRSFI